MTTTQMTPATFALRDAIREMLDDASDTSTGDTRARRIDNIITSTSPQHPELMAMLQGRGYCPNDTATWDYTEAAGYAREVFDMVFDFATVRVVISPDDADSVTAHVMARKSSRAGRTWDEEAWGVNFRWTPLLAIDAMLAAAETMAEGI